ncbi:MAG: multidrug efflux SMR transporter [Bacteroidota bacterium]
MAWMYLLFAALFEIGWPLGFKLSQTYSENKIFWIIIATLSMALSGLFLWFAQKEIPIGTAYAVWTGIGAAGTFIIGIIYFRDAASLIRIASATLIVMGVIGLRLAH